MLPSSLQTLAVSTKSRQGLEGVAAEQHASTWTKPGTEALTFRNMSCQNLRGVTRVLQTLTRPMCSARACKVSRCLEATDEAAIWTFGNR